MIQKNGKVCTGKKKTYSFSLSIDNINQFNGKIGLAPKSKVVDILISDFVDKRNSLSLTTRHTHHKKTSKDRDQRL